MTTPAPAVLALQRAGIAPSQLAEALGVSRQAVSFQLTGKAATTSPGLLTTIATLGGGELAAQVAALIERTRREAAAS